MKKAFSLLLAVFITVIPAAMLFGQTPDPAPPPGTEVVLPDLPITFDVKQYVKTFLYYAATVVMLTSIINRWLTNLKGFAKQYLSWFIALIVGFAAYFLNLGIFEPIVWWQVLLYALAAGLGANGLFDWQAVQWFLRAIKLEPAEVKRE